MYYNDNSASECFFSMLIVGALSWFSHNAGRQSAFKEIEEKNQKDKISYLEQEVSSLKRKKQACRKSYDWNDLRDKLKLKRIS